MKKKSGKIPAKRSRTLWPRDGEEFIGNLGDTMIYGLPMKLKEKGPHPIKIPYAEIDAKPVTMAEFKKKALDSVALMKMNAEKD